MADSPDVTQAPESTPAAAPPPPATPEARSRPARTPGPRDAYYYDGTADTYHPIVGLIKVGLNRWPEAEADVAEAIQAMVQKGILRQG